MTIQKHVSLKEQAYTAIRTAIVKKKIAKDTIYSEQWFADRFQISRTPVREAILQLRTEGLLDVLPNRGVVVKNLTERDARNILFMRAAIEGFCSEHLARHVQEPEAQESLKKIYEAILRCHEDFNIRDEMFIHEETVRFADNPLISKQFSNLQTQMETFWWSVIEVTNRREEVYREHLRIYECMACGNERGAYEAAREHSFITLARIRTLADFALPEELRMPDEGEKLF